CLTDRNYARECSARSREIGRLAFSYSSLRPKYEVLLSRAEKAFADRARRGRSFSFPGLNLGLRFRVGVLGRLPRFRQAVLEKTYSVRRKLGLRRKTLNKVAKLVRND